MRRGIGKLHHLSPLTQVRLCSGTTFNACQISPGRDGSPTRRTHCLSLKNWPQTPWALLGCSSCDGGDEHHADNDEPQQRRDAGELVHSAPPCAPTILQATRRSIQLCGWPQKDLHCLLEVVSSFRAAVRNLPQAL